MAVSARLRGERASAFSREVNRRVFGWNYSRAPVGSCRPSVPGFGSGRETGRAGKLDGQGHAARGWWNLLHAWHTTCREHRRPMLAMAEVDRQMREARRNPPEGFAWLSALPVQAGQQVLKRHQTAWKRCYAGLARPPRSGPGAVHVAALSRLWGRRPGVPPRPGNIPVHVVWLVGERGYHQRKSEHQGGWTVVHGRGDLRVAGDGEASTTREGGMTATGNPPRVRGGGSQEQILRDVAHTVAPALGRRPASPPPA
ncbi:hypothetical protein FF36_00507 [Frankia torreyi]|uniref:Uncharacterized protein n=1 Tax=Frankia torreyi TaxID=1856 RepID=A0A0D8BMZ2_9ACTN|nr:hypothetical protein FF36_00507 [Frankia torreyi]